MTSAAQEHSAIRRATVFIGDLVGAAAIIASIPLAILVLGIPLALVVRLLLWMTAQI